MEENKVIIYRENKATIIYQLLSCALIVTLVCMVMRNGGKAKVQDGEDAVSGATAAYGHEGGEQPEEAEPAEAQPEQGWRQVVPSEIKDNPIELLDGYKGILAMGNEEEHNAMTIGWGALGMLWGRPVLSVFVSSSRFSHSLMEKNGMFTVSFFNKTHFDDVMYLGRHSGRDGDKISKTSLHLTYTKDGNPMFEEAFMVIECRKIYGAPFDVGRIAPEASRIYANGLGMHSEYVGEIVSVHVNDANRAEQ